ncbi:cobyric acid synthase [Thalassorhabdus alkalitolerans]|uniref:Cobyric acid synthase n=1 Tax=Thalassorhabdus alkalitolerans TaxID=2282697 RepID=A0ABW0YL91_9BACI
MKGIIVWGTTSDAGKSFIVTGLCRALSNRGYKVAPFKAQNMSNNSYVTLSGHEIGRSQGMQAEACRVEPTVHMNPVLLKPRSDRRAEVLIQGKSMGNPSAKSYRRDFFSVAEGAMAESLDELKNEYEYIIMEGAGSPAEVNLMDKDLANLKAAELADVPAILVGDIERGGVFASLVGTMELLPPEHQQRVECLIVNRFRGDPELFIDGKKWLEEKTGSAVHVFPKLEISMEKEDSLSLPEIEKRGYKPGAQLDIGVVHFPYLSNYTDVEPLLAEKDLSLRIIRKPEDWGDPDVVLLPGTKSTFADLHAITQTGVGDLIKGHVEQGGILFGICGGYQIMGEKLIDKEGTETGVIGKEEPGLSFLPFVTSFISTKTTRRKPGLFTHASGQSFPLDGFEIHLGSTLVDRGNEPPFMVEANGNHDGVYAKDGQIIGTYLHHVFHNDDWRTWWLNQLRIKKGIPVQEKVSYTKIREDQYEVAAEAIEQYLDLDKLINVMKKNENASKGGAI